MNRDATLRARGGTVGPTRSGIGLNDLAMLGTVAAVVGLFLISPVTLEAHGIAYLTSGGGLFSKLHPSTFVAGAALGLRCLGSPRPFAKGWRLLTSDTGAVVLLVAVAFAGFCATMIDQTPVTPLIDTFILPVLVFLLLRDLDPIVMRWLALLITIVLCLNALIAITEFLRGWHLVHIDVPDGASPDPTRGDTTFDWRAQLSLDWRATALLGHPLSNGLIAGAFIICLSAAGTKWLPGSVKLPMILLQFVSMFAFGARTSLVLSVAFAAWLGLGQAIEGIGRGARLRPQQIAITFMVIALLIAGGAIILQSGFADRTIDRFSDDAGSATTRITMFNLFQPLSVFDMLFGPDKDVVATWQRLEGLEFGIESSWVGLALIYGLVVTGMLVIGTLALALSVARASGRGAFMVLLLYFILASVAATMSGKTTTYGMIVCLVMVFLHKDERPVPLRVASLVGAAR